MIGSFGIQLFTESSGARNRTSRSVWSARSLLPLLDASGDPKREQAPRTPYASRQLLAADEIAHSGKSLMAPPALSPRLLQVPLVPAIGITMTMGRKEPAAMLPEPGPKLLDVGLRNLQPGQGLAGEELKPALPMHRRHRRQFEVHLE